MFRRLALAFSTLTNCEDFIDRLENEKTIGEEKLAKEIIETIRKDYKDR